MEKFIYKPPAISGMQGYYCILLPDGSEAPILNRLVNPNYIHNGRRVFLTDGQCEELRRLAAEDGTGESGHTGQSGTHTMMEEVRLCRKK